MNYATLILKFPFLCLRRVRGNPYKIGARGNYYTETTKQPCYGHIGIPEAGYPSLRIVPNNPPQYFITKQGLGSQAEAEGHERVGKEKREFGG
jgi:hypothetical protein